MNSSGELNNTNGLQNMGAADFGVGGITMPDQGYVVFKVVSSDGTARPSCTPEFRSRIRHHRFER